jgi:hypothetical protein
MAVTTLSLITLAQEYRGPLVAQINRTTTALRMISVKQGGGLNLNFTARKDGSTARSHNEGVDAGTPDGDDQVPVVIPWAEYDTTMAITDLTIAAGASAIPGASAPENDDVWGEKILEKTEVLTSKLNRDFFWGDGTTKSLFGLDKAVGSDTNTYGNIDRSVGSNSFWVPNIFDPGTPTAITLQSIRRDLNAIYVRSGRTPDIAFVSPDVFATIAALFDDKRMYVVESKSVDVAGRNSVTLNGGADVIRFGGCTFVQDKDAAFSIAETAGRIWYCNSALIEFQYLELVDPRTRAALGNQSANDGNGQFSLFGISPMKLPNTGHAEKALLMTKPQLKIARPNAFGVRKNVLIAA